MPLVLDLAIGGVAICPPGSGVAVRVLPTYELVWVIEGEATWTCGHVTHAVPPDTVVIARPGMREAWRWDPRQPTHVAYLYFSVQDGLDLLPPQERWPVLHDLGGHDVVRPLLRQVMWLREEQPPGWHAVAHEAACHALTSLVTGMHMVPGSVRTSLPWGVERAVLYVKRAWDEAGVHRNVELDELCRAVAISPRHLSRQFKDTFGAGPARTLRLARLEVAADLLQYTDFAVAKVAELTGFANAFHFSRAFKEAHGVAPREFAERARTSGMVPRAERPAIRRLVGRLLPRPLDWH